MPNTSKIYSFNHVEIDYNFFVVPKTPTRQGKEYCLFGAPMPGRNFNSNSTRYGFNGKEKDDEINVSGGSYDFGNRLYDSRLGKWWSIDKLSSKYPFQSPYSFALNNPIYFVDPDGNVVIPGNELVTAAITAKLNTTFSGELEKYRKNFVLETVKYKVGDKEIEVQAFVFKPSTTTAEGATDIFQVNKAIRDSKLSTKDKLMALAYANVINDPDGLIVASLDAVGNQKYNMGNPINPGDGGIGAAAEGDVRTNQTSNEYLTGSVDGAESEKMHVDARGLKASVLKSRDAKTGTVAGVSMSTSASGSLIDEGITEFQDMSPAIKSQVYVKDAAGGKQSLNRSGDIITTPKK